MRPFSSNSAPFGLKPALFRWVPAPGNNNKYYNVETLANRSGFRATRSFPGLGLHQCDDKSPTERADRFTQSTTTTGGAAKKIPSACSAAVKRARTPPPPPPPSVKKYNNPLSRRLNTYICKNSIQGDAGVIIPCALHRPTVSSPLIDRARRR